MLMLQGFTPEETKTSIIEFLEMEAERYNRGSLVQRLKIDRACDKARANALLDVARTLRDAALTDLKRYP